MTAVPQLPVSTTGSVIAAEGREPSTRRAWRRRTERRRNRAATTGTGASRAYRLTAGLLAMLILMLAAAGAPLLEHGLSIGGSPAQGRRRPPLFSPPLTDATRP